jgi:cytoskeletal protein CcmA (bactofilin family)
MTQFASETAAVALGGSDRRRVDFSATEGTLTTQPDASWICIQNGSAAAADRELVLPESNDPAETCDDVQTPMGAAVYDTGDGRIAYEGGGVWTSDADGNSRMVSPPEFHYRGQTLTLPVVQLHGDVRAAGPQVGLVATAGATDRVDISNPLPEDSGSVYVTVGSEFYQAWGRFIAERTDGRVVELDHDAETVTVELVVPSPVTIENAVYSGGQDGNAVQVQNLDVDSYDSATYSSSTAKDNGDVVTDGGINPIEGTIDGDVYTVRNGKKIKMTSGGRVNGSVHSQKRVVVDSGVVEDSIFAENPVDFKGQEVGESVHADGKVTLGSSGLTVGDEVRTTGDLSFGSSGVTVDGDVHAAKLKSLGQSPDLNGDVYTSGFYGERGNRVGVSLSGELHAGDGIYTDGTEIDGAAYTDGDFEDTDSVYGGEVHVGGNADLSGTEVSKTVYVAGNAELGSATINDDLHVGGDLTCPESNTVTGSVNVDGTVAESCSLNLADPPSVMAPTSPDDPQPPKSPDEPTPDPPKIELPPEDEIDPINDTDCTNGGTIQVQSGETCRLSPGTYDVSKLDVDQGKLIFEEGGRVELYVSDDLSLSSGNITTAPAGEHDATRVEVNYYGNQEASVLANFTGVINAPNVKVDMDEGNYKPHIFGAVIAKQVQGDNGVQIHYDEDLSGQTVGAGQGDVPSIRYLHITTNEMTIED